MREESEPRGQVTLSRVAIKRLKIMAAHNDVPMYAILDDAVTQRWTEYLVRQEADAKLGATVEMSHAA